MNKIVENSQFMTPICSPCSPLASKIYLTIKLLKAESPPSSRINSKAQACTIGKTLSSTITRHWIWRRPLPAWRLSVPLRPLTNSRTHMQWCSPTFKARTMCRVTNRTSICPRSKTKKAVALVSPNLYLILSTRTRLSREGRNRIAL